MADERGGPGQQRDLRSRAPDLRLGRARADPQPAVALLDAAQLREPAQVHEVVEDRQQNILLGGEVIRQLATAHVGPFFNLRQREILQALLGDNCYGRLDNLFASNRSNLALFLLFPPVRLH